MKSYIKIYGPPILKALKCLEKIAAETPEVLIKSYYSEHVPQRTSSTYAEDLRSYFDSISQDMSVDIPSERRDKLISESSHTLGDDDFFFEWARDPTWKEVDELIEKIDEELAPLGCKYTISTK